MSEDAVRGLIIAHSSLAAGFAAAVRQIAGVGDDVIQAISNEGLGPEELLEKIRLAVGDSPVVIFTDLPSGSCAFAARKIGADRPGTGMICGVNLPILLDFAFHRELPLQSLVDRLLDKGRVGISGACIEDGDRADRAFSG